MASTTSRGHEPSFPRFKQLPIELRCLIWEFALPAGRVVRAHYGSEYTDNYSQFFIATEVVNPVLLYVSREARASSLRYYSPFPGLLDVKTRRPVLIDFENDILFLSSVLGAKATNVIKKDLPEESRCKVKRLAILLNDVDIVMPILSIFKNRTEVNVVHTLGRDEFVGENVNLRLDEIELGRITPARSSKLINEDGNKPPTDLRVSDILDQEMSFFGDKWDQRKTSFPSWKAPRLVFASLECDRVKAVYGASHQRHGGIGMYRRTQITVQENMA